MANRGLPCETTIGVRSFKNGRQIASRSIVHSEPACREDREAASRRASAAASAKYTKRTDRNNIAPRIGVAWRPWDNRTVLRAGYGIYFDVVPFTATIDGVPFRINEPTFTNPADAPAVILPRVSPATTGGPYSVSLPAAVQADQRVPYSMQWNFTVEHERWQTGFRLSYAGTNTRQGEWAYKVNQPVVDTRLFVDKPRPFPKYPAINYRGNGSGHQYHGLTAEAERQFASGLYYQSSWVWARDIGDLERGESPENAFDRRRERAVWADIERLVDRIKRLGITTQASRDIVNKMIAAQLDLSKATELARLAQDAAVVAGQDSSQALQGIMHGITTQQIEVLRTYGINVQFEREFLAARQRLGRDLTDLERKNVALNRVLAEAPKIAGAYEASLGTVGKQMTSLARYVEEAKAAIGEQFLPEMRKAIQGLTELAQWTRENADTVAAWAKGIAAAAVGAAIGKFVGWMAGAKKGVDALTLALARNPLTAVAIAATVAGTALYDMYQGSLAFEERLKAQNQTAADTSRILYEIGRGKTAEDLKNLGYSVEQIRAAFFGAKEGAEDFLAAFDNEQFGLRIKIVNEKELAAIEQRAREELARDMRKKQGDIERDTLEAAMAAERAMVTGPGRELLEFAEKVRAATIFVDAKGNEHALRLTHGTMENLEREHRAKVLGMLKDSTRQSVELYREEYQQRLGMDTEFYQRRIQNDLDLASRNLQHVERMYEAEEARAGIARDAQLRQVEAFDAQTIEQKLAAEQRKMEIEIEYLERTHEIKMRLFDLETSRTVLEEEANLKWLGYRADEIKARIAELTRQREEIRQANQEATDAAIDTAHQNAANRTAAMVRDHNRQIFDSFKRQAEGVFDALLTKSQSIWSAIGNSLKTALLTAIKVVTSRVAAMLMQLFSGQRVSLVSQTPGGGILGGLGGLVGVGAVPVLGGVSVPATTPPAGGGLPSKAAWAGSLANLKSFLGIGGSVQVGAGAATTWEAATTLQKLSAIGKSNAALLGGGMLLYEGLRRGGAAGVGMSAAGGAMIGFKYGGPLGAAIGGAAGAVTGLVRLFVKGAQEKAREKIKATYGVDISDKNVLKQIVDIAKQGFGGNLDMAIRSQQIRDLVELYALATGQGASGLPATVRPVSLFQQGGSLFQQSASWGFTFDRIGSGVASAAAPTVINITVPGAREFFEKETVRVVVKNPRAVQSAVMTATRQNAGRREMTGLQLSPGLLTS